MSEYEGILDSLEEVHKKLDRFLAVGSARQTEKKEVRIHSPGFEDSPEPKKELPLTIEKTVIKGGRTIPQKGSGKYEWFSVNGLPGVKVRACSNEGCPYYLKYSEEKGKYEHWRYDPNTKEGGFVQDNCDYYGGV